MERRPQRKRRKRRRGPQVPDIIYHGSNVERMEGYVRSGYLDPGQGRQVFLSVDESEAWRVAHRFNSEPVVLYVDAGRARRDGVRFHRTRNGLWVSGRIPARHILNLRPGFAEQMSAGGFLVRQDRGVPEVALVACTRRSGTTWEIAKGKLEMGETPEQAACRELQEEMGFETPLTIRGSLGKVRYAFQTPEGEPRLKSLYVYILEAQSPPEDFTPADAEGITDVRWFSLAEATRRVTHSSLRPLMGELAHALARARSA